MDKNFRSSGDLSQVSLCSFLSTQTCLRGANCVRTKRNCARDVGSWLWSWLPSKRYESCSSLPEGEAPNTLRSQHPFDTKNWTSSWWLMASSKGAWRRKENAGGQSETTSTLDGPRSDKASVGITRATKRARARDFPALLAYGSPTARRDYSADQKSRPMLRMPQKHVRERIGEGG